MHTTGAPIKGYGQVYSNGLIIISKGEAILVDTPTTNDQTEELVKLISDSLQVKIVKFIPTHWHSDCIGGIEYLHNIGIASYSNEMTIDLCKENGVTLPQHGFKNSLQLGLNGMDVECHFLGGGHSLDNFVVWIPAEKVLFGGCLIKDMSSTTPGNTTDGDIDAWPVTIAGVLERFSEARVVVPGHGEFGGLELAKHTQALLTK